MRYAKQFTMMCAVILIFSVWFGAKIGYRSHKPPKQCAFNANSTAYALNLVVNYHHEGKFPSTVRHADFSDKRIVLRDSRMCVNEAYGTRSIATHHTKNKGWISRESRKQLSQLMRILDNKIGLQASDPSHLLPEKQRGFTHRLHISGTYRGRQIDWKVAGPGHSPNSSLSYVDNDSNKTITNSKRANDISTLWKIWKLIASEK